MHCSSLSRVLPPVQHRLLRSCEIEDEMHTINEEVAGYGDDEIEQSLNQMVLETALAPVEAVEVASSEDGIEEPEPEVNADDDSEVPPVEGGDEVVAEPEQEVNAENDTEVPPVEGGGEDVGEQTVEQRVVRRRRTPYWRRRRAIPTRVQLRPRWNPVTEWIVRNVFLFSSIAMLLWFFATIITVVGFYGSKELLLNEGCSILLQPYRFFVQSIDAELPSDTDEGPILYGFHNKPPLDIISTWSDTRVASLEANADKVWVYFLNEGSQLNISYSVVGSSSLLFTVGHGRPGYHEWLYSQQHPIATMVHGNGSTLLNASIPGSYHISMDNLNSEVVEVELNISVSALLYDTTEAYYMCMLARGPCSIPLSLFGNHVAVLTSPRLKQGDADAEWLVRLTFAPRWTVYLCGAGAITFFSLVVIGLFAINQCIHGPRPDVRTPLLLDKDEDDSVSSGSSNDSLSEDGEHKEDMLRLQDQDGESSDRTCIICFERERGCYFLPCGHSVACFICGTRIIEESATCPLCRSMIMRMKKKKQKQT